MATTAVIQDALHTAGAVTAADEARLSQAAGWARATTGIGVRTGCAYLGASSLVTATATTAPMTVQVQPLAFVGQKAALEGAYIGASKAVVSVDIAAAPGTAGQSRIDVVYVMQRDANSTTSPDGVTQGEVGVITGTAAVSPAKPSIPVGAVEVGTVTVPYGATATTGCTVSTTCSWTAPLGAPIPVRSLAERNALTAYESLRVWRLDTHTIEQYSGTAWVPQYFQRLYVQSQAPGSSLANLGAIATLALSAAPVATRVHLTAIGMIGYSASGAQSFGLNISASAGTLTSGQGNQQTRCETAAQWYDYAWLGYLDVPANTAVTITTTFSTPGANGWWKGNLHAQVYVLGEY